MIVKSIGVVSLGKIMGALYAIFGFIFGAIFSLISLVGVAGSMGEGSGMMGGIVGLGAIILMPLIYGVLGFIGGVITAFIYNVVAGMAGGLELEIEGYPPQTGAAQQAPPPVR